ncbi:hypothetical protein CMUS01_12187 [Colletotrichum musicola]|uniref:GAG-pre-integrase domain-containing protein n=1 Tax=Colletotrichum musicola TaxID=2175873 RepID=A0A8H6N1I9_9PEZI|nr:hypothetical protein CMUS01_12187 [Colletotrichum musicola]
MRKNELIGPNGRVLDTLDMPKRGFNLSVTTEKRLPESRVMWTAQQRKDSQLWHRRLGHPGHREILKTIELTRGCPLTAKDIVPQPCATYDMSKSLRYSPRTPRERALRAGDLLHIDIGEIKPALWFTYFCLVTDDKSRFRALILSNSKGDLARQLHNYLTG